MLLFLSKLYACFILSLLHVLSRLWANDKIAEVNSQITMFSARDERPCKYAFLAPFSDIISLFSLFPLHSTGNMELQ